MVIVIVSLWFLFNEAISPGYTYNFWLTLDQLANIVLWGDAETISARLGKSELEGNWFSEKFCNILDQFFKEADHCVKAIDK